MPDARWGESVKACVVLRPERSAGEDELIAHCRSLIASYKKPQHVCFLPELPRTAASRQVHKPLLREIVVRAVALQRVSRALRGARG